MPKIFISYRRGDAGYQARMLADRLTSEFGRDSVFIDIDSIPLWVDFERHIVDSIEASDAVVALIGDYWLTELNARRDDPIDYVRFEIRSALERGIPVIPVLVARAEVPKPGTLPPDLAPLLKVTFPALREGPDLTGQINLLMKSLGSLPQRSRRPASSNPTKRPQTPPPLKEITIVASTDRIYHVRVATSLELGRQAEASFPLGAFEEARHFTDAQKSSWTRLSRRQVRLSIASAGLTLEDLRDGAARAERVAYFNDAAWPATAGPVVLPPDRQASYEIADVVRWTFHPLRAVPAHPAPTPEIERIVRKTRLGGCEVRVQWPGADATSRHLLLMLWSAAAFAPGSAADGGLFLLTRSDGLWLGSLTDASPLMVDSVTLAAGELAPLAPGRQIERPAAGRCAGGASLALTCS